MSRSGYTDDCDGWDLIRWRGAVKSAVRGKRGQAFLREMLVALDAMPDKRLIAEDLIDADGDVCAMGAVGLRRGVNLEAVDPEDREQVAKAFGIAGALAAEIAWENDEPCHPEERWLRMRAWIVARIYLDEDELRRKEAP